MNRRPVGLFVWLVVLGAAQAAALWLVFRYFVGTASGQTLDTIALAGALDGDAGDRLGRAAIENRVGTILNAVSAASLAAATAFVGFVALVRRRVALAVGALLLIAGANLTTQLLKYGLVRPDFGIDPERAAAGNSLPSGHTTVAASVAVALVLVLPAKLRAVAGVLGAAAVAAVGVATLSAGWHRPSDAVAAMLVVGAWACAAGMFTLVAQRRNGGVEYDRPHVFAVALLMVAGAVLVAGAAAALGLTARAPAVPPEELSGRRLLLAYAGGAAGIAGAAALV
ncbi:MAG TPA: phosphatase PAP2 family protein, partial [Micromonosporaceae bacterium]|nr:phosphatase PAP2 family protein [Micromonosporaceae bacterium]